MSNREKAQELNECTNDCKHCPAFDFCLWDNLQPEKECVEIIEEYLNKKDEDRRDR